MPEQLGRTKFTAGGASWLKVTDCLHCVTCEPVTGSSRFEWHESLRCLNPFENNFVLSNHCHNRGRTKPTTLALSVPMLKFFHMWLDMNNLS